MIKGLLSNKTNDPAFHWIQLEYLLIFTFSIIIVILCALKVDHNQPISGSFCGNLMLFSIPYPYRIIKNTRYKGKWYTFSSNSSTTEVQQHPTTPPTKMSKLNSTQDPAFWVEFPSSILVFVIGLVGVFICSFAPPHWEVITGCLAGGVAVIVAAVYPIVVYLRANHQWSTGPMQSSNFPLC